MRKITQESVQAFYNSESFSKQNMTVSVLSNCTTLALHGNVIAYRYNDPERTLSITTCGWDTTTIKERLNGLDGVKVNTSKGQLCLNGMPWDGELRDIN